MRKSLIILSALLLAGIGAKAQSVDVSSKLLGNAQSNWTGATGTYSAGGAERYQTANYTASDGKVLYQSISGLDNGIYEVTFYAVASSTTNRGFDNIYGTGFAQVFANSTVMDVTVFEQAGCTPSDYEYTLTCEVTNGTLEFGLQNVGTGGNWYVCQGISLVYSGTALNTGDTYYASVADLCQWSISPTPDGEAEKFQRNTWSTEADVSGMKPPFIEYWHGSGNNLDDAVISHKTLTGLTPGLYEVSVFARAFNEGSTTAVGKGITFTANGESVDLTTGTTGAYSGSAEVYGTYTLVAEVTEAGTLSIGFTIDSETSCDWVAWKNLKVVYDGESLPALDYVEGIMNADVEAAMKAAVDAYNSSKSTDDYAAAVSAIAAAEASVAYYAPIAAIVEALDEAGLAVWNATTNGQAYAARSLTSEDVSADLIAAQLAQTTEGSDLSYAMQNTGSWSAAQGNGPGACPSLSTANETYNDSGAFTEGDVLYYTVTGLQPGTYTVTFYAVENSCNGVDTTTGNIAEAFANEASSTLTVGSVSNMGGSWEGYTAWTITCTVGYDGKLTFGVRNTSTGGNWCVAEAVSLTLVELTENPYVYDVTKLLANPSFEEDNVSTLTEDGTRNHTDDEDAENSYTGGAYLVENLTGWTLVAQKSGANDWADCDLMTSDCQRTDNGFGAPGTPTDGSQMLYIRDAWTEYQASVEQTVTLPAGEYKLAVDTKCVTTGSGHSASLVAADNSVALTIHSTMPEDWDTASVKFSLDKETAVTLGVDISFANAAGFSVLLDNFRLYSETDVVEWTLGADYGTLILPFAAAVPTGLTAYTAGTVSNDELSLTDAESITANTPYIIGGGTTGTYYFAGVPENGSTTSYTDGSSILTGTLPEVQTSSTGYLYTEPTTVAVSQGNYVLQLQDEEEGPMFYLVDSDDITCGSYHCYLNESAVSGDAGAKSSVRLVFGGVATAVEAVETEETAGSGAVYDLSGRRVAKAQKGVYIVNGKKKVIK